MAISLLGLRGVLGLTLVRHISLVAVLVVSSVGHYLDTAVGKIDPVGSLEVAIGILVLLLLEAGTSVFISNTILIGERLRDLLLLLVRGGVVRGSGLVGLGSGLVSRLRLVGLGSGLVSGLRLIGRGRLVSGLGLVGRGRLVRSGLVGGLRLVSRGGLVSRLWLVGSRLVGRLRLVSRGGLISRLWLVGSWLVGGLRLVSGGRLVSRGGLVFGSRLVSRGGLVLGSRLVDGSRLIFGGWLVDGGGVFGGGIRIGLVSHGEGHKGGTDHNLKIKYFVISLFTFFAPMAAIQAPLIFGYVEYSLP